MDRWLQKYKIITPDMISDNAVRAILRDIGATVVSSHQKGRK